MEANVRCIRVAGHVSVVSDGFAIEVADSRLEKGQYTGRWQGKWLKYSCGWKGDIIERRKGGRECMRERA